MGEVINVLNELTKGDAIIVTDVGQHQMVACRYAKFNQTKSNITSGGLGTMGFALPAASVQNMVHPNRTVVAIIGDGGIPDDDAGTGNNHAIQAECKNHYPE